MQSGKVLYEKNQRGNPMEAMQGMSGKIRMTRRLLGSILLDGAFVSPDDLKTAIERQRKASAQLGEILVGMGVLNGADLEAVLSVQKEFACPEDTIKAAAGVRELLGELLLRAKRLTPESLKEALAEQHRTGLKLGDILVRKGYLRESELDTILAFQEQQSSKELQPSPLRLGEILVRTRAITREKLEEALKRQKLSHKKIGEILVESGYIKPGQLDHGCRLQQKLITAALVGMLSFVSLSPAKAFDLPPSRSGAKMQINIAAVVKARTNMNIIRRIQEIVVNNTDIDRGYVDVPVASLGEAESDSPKSDIPPFEGLDWPFHKAQAGELAQEIMRISGGADAIQQPSLQGTTARGPNIRFILAENAQPGTYGPLTISAPTR